jgi:hypothetical protein
VLVAFIKRGVSSHGDRIGISSRRERAGDFVNPRTLDLELSTQYGTHQLLLEFHARIAKQYPRPANIKITRRRLGL